MKLSSTAVTEFKRSLKSLSLGVVLSCLASLSSLTLMGTAGYFLTIMGVAGFWGISVNIFIFSSIIRLSALLRTLLRYLERIINHHLTFKVIERWRSALFNKMLSLPLDEALHLRSHDVERTLRHDLGVIESLYIREILPIFCAVILSTILLLVLFFISKPLAVMVSFFVAAAVLVLPLVVMKIQGASYYRKTLLSEQLQRQSGNLILGLFDLQSAGAVPFLYRRTQASAIKKALFAGRRLFYDGLLSAMLTSLALLSFPLTILILIPMVEKGLISGPLMIALAIVVMSSFEFLMPLPAAVFAIKESLVSLKRIYNLEKKAVTRRSGPDVDTAIHTDAEGRILGTELSGRVSSLVFDKVTFKRGNLPVIKDFSYTFKSSENYLITGRTGCGKTTLIHLLTGLLDPDEGTLRADGICIGTFNQIKWREHYALSLQENSFIPGTVREILKGSLNKVSEQSFFDVLRCVNLEKTIKALPAGLDTYLDGITSSLSGGEMRRLSLARALILKREFLILDEPFEGLDDNNVRIILQNLSSLKGGVIIISHRKMPQRLDKLNIIKLD